jgi:hypothetical protein
MKHIKTFESFLNESLIEKKEELYIAHVDDSRKPGGSDKDIKKTYSLEVRDRDRDGFDIVGSKEDIQAFVDEYNIILVDGIESIDEANDLSYWKDYADGSSQSPKWYSNDAKNPSAVNKLVDAVVNHELDELDDKDADIDPSDMKALTDLAMKYFKKFGSINGHVVSAMLFQEAKESFINERYKHKFRIGDYVNFGDEKARIDKVYTTNNGKAMYTIGSSKHGNFEIEAEDVDRENK